VTRRSPAGLRSGLVLASLIALVGACGGASTTGTATDGTTVIPTPDVGGASPSAGSSRAPTPEPSRDPGTVAVERFVAFASKPTASYQATFTGESRQTITVVKITKGTLQVDGDDVRVRATFTFPDRKSGVVEHRYVADKAWIRLEPHAWQRLVRFTAADSMAAFPAVRGPADVQYLGPVKYKGDPAWLVLVRSSIVHPAMVPESNLTEPRVTSGKLTVVIDSAGRPLSGAAEIRGQGRVSKQLQEIVIDLDLTFSKVGQPVSIAAP
jgi:hypothetical protein